MPRLAPQSYSQLVATLPEHLAEFLGTDVHDVRRRMAGARDERNRRWIEAGPTDEAQRNELYSSLGELDLLKYAEWHLADREKMKLHDEMLSAVRPGTECVLDCGGGIGDTALAFAVHGADVSYMDFPGVCSDFARFRWAKYGCAEHIRAWTPAQFWGTNESSFDLLASIDVLEHLENPVKHAARYHDLLAPGGELFVTTFFEHSPRNPDHLPENDGLRRVFGGEPKTARRCVLTNLGFRRKTWYRFQRPLAP